MEEYTAARRKYEAEADAYWSSVAEKRRLRQAKLRKNQEIVPADYVLAQPPIYSGPPKPVDPSAPIEAAPPKKYVPLVADFLRAAAQEFGFVPQQPRSEIEYKRAYVKVAFAAGLTKEQVVRIYAFESGGDGKYDVQAGLEQPKPGAQAISTALGYNQLLATNSVELMAEKGDQFIKTLSEKAAQLSEEAKATLQKELAVLKRMISFCRSVPDSWSEHDKLANTPKGLAIHALNLGRSLAADAEAPGFRAVRARTGLRHGTKRGRARDDESHRRRQRPRHPQDATGIARARAHLEFLPAGRL